jgi:hypothetical protein
LVANCRLIGQRQLPGQKEPQDSTHFTARIRLTKEAPKAAAGLEPGAPAGAIVEAADIYRLYFHGPAYQVLERAWRNGDKVVGQMPQSLPSNHQPTEAPTRIAPRLIELCFQTAGLWEMGVQGRMGLPQRLDQVMVCREPEHAEGALYAVVTPNPDQASFNAEVVDAKGNRYLEVTGYRTVALPNAIDAGPLKALANRSSMAAAD